MYVIRTEQLLQAILILPDMMQGCASSIEKERKKENEREGERKEFCYRDIDGFLVCDHLNDSWLSLFFASWLFCCSHRTCKASLHELQANCLQATTSNDMLPELPSSAGRFSVAAEAWELEWIRSNRCTCC